MRGARPDMQDVVLDEGGAPAGLEAPGPRQGVPGTAGPATPPVNHSRRRRRLWRPAAAVLVLTAGLAVGDRVTVRDTSRPDPEPLDVAGALAPVGGPVRELWRSPDLLADGLVEVSGLLVGTARRADDSVDLVGVDPATGTTTWSTRLLDGGPRHGGAQCVTPQPTVLRYPLPRRPPDARGGRRTVCVTADAVGPVDDFSPLSVVEPTRARRLVVDVVTGDVVREEPVDPTTSVAALDGDVAVITVGPDGVLRVARTDVLGTTERWSFTSPEPLRSTRYGRPARVTVRGDLVVAGGGAGWSLAAGGTPLQSWAPTPEATGRTEVLGDRLLVQPAPTSGLRFTVLDLRDGGSFVVDGRPVGAALDDGSARDVVLVQARGDTLAAHAAPSGRRLWSVPDGGTGAPGLLVLGGRVVRLEDDAVSAVDVRSGETVWSTAATPASRMRLATDGRVVLCATRDADRGLVLRALAVDNGRPRWDVDLPDDLEDLVVRGGRLFGVTRSGLVALG